MSSLYILLLLSVGMETLGELEEGVKIDDSKFGPLEPSDSPKNLTVVPRVTDFTEILAVNNAIKSFQKKLEKKPNYLPERQAFLTTTIAAGGGDEEFNFIALVSSFLNNNESNIYIKKSRELSANKQFSNVSTTKNSRIVNCINVVPLNLTDISIEVVNSTRLSHVLESDPEVPYPRSPGVCTLVFFYARSCQFSILAAPHFNVLPRIFPQIKMVAFNAISEQRFNTMYGITGVPSLVLFHNGKPFMKFTSDDYSLYEFTKFVMRHTEFAPIEKVKISTTDFVKPVPGFRNSDDHYSLCLAWFVILFWTLEYVRTTNFWQNSLEKIRNIWRKAETQNKHAD